MKDISEDDLVCALGHFLQLSAGRAVRSAHPLATEWHRDRRSLNAVRESAGMTTTDFSAVTASALSLILARTYAGYVRDLDRVLTDVPVTDFRRQSLESFTVGPIPEIDSEDAEIPRLPITLVSDAPTAGLREYAGSFRMSHRLWVTSGQALEQAIRGYAKEFAAIESQLLANVLSSSSTVQTATGNLDAAGLSAASTKLRRAAEAGGGFGNWAVAGLIVPPELENTAYTLRLVVYGPSGGPAVVVLPELQAGSWYAVGSPETARGIVRLRLRGGSSGPVVEYGRAGADIGKTFLVGFDTNILLANPHSVIKVSS